MAALNSRVVPNTNTLTKATVLVLFLKKVRKSIGVKDDERFN